MTARASERSFTSSESEREASTIGARAPTITLATRPLGISAAVRQSFAWANGLVHADNQGRRHLTNAFECREESDGKSTTFVWLTNLALSHDRQVMVLANGGGHCRWKVENEGFNTQKNGGYTLEHAYSTHGQPGNTGTCFCRSPTS